MNIGWHAALLKKLLSWLRTVLGLGAALLILVYLNLPYPAIYIDLETMLPEESEITQTIHEAQHRFGPTDYVVIGITHRDRKALDSAGAAQLAAVQLLLLDLPGTRAEDVTSMLSDRARVVRTDGSDVQGTRILRDTSDCPDSVERTRSSSLYHCLLSEEGRSILLLLRTREPEEGKRAFLRQLRTSLASITQPGFEIIVGGQLSVFAEPERYTQNIFLVLHFTLLLIGLIHYEAFRSMQGMVCCGALKVNYAGVHSYQESFRSQKTYRWVRPWSSCPRRNHDIAIAVSRSSLRGRPRRRIERGRCYGSNSMSGPTEWSRLIILS